MPPPTERLHMSITTSSGELQAQVEMPTGFIPITQIVPLMRALGEQAQELEITNTRKRGKIISCQKGCGACCRPMIPVSQPEAFALIEAMSTLPQDHQRRIKQNLATTQERLKASGLLNRLKDLTDSPHQHSDVELESLNQAYYALRLPCIFLENEMCSIYEHRPAGCRSHLVTSPAELCQDMVNNPIVELPIPLRAGTVLSLLWSNLMGGPVRLMPLPIAVEWADNHQDLNTQTWEGSKLFQTAMDELGKYLQQTVAANSPKTSGT